MYQYLLFDLDGTLTDPKEGITKCAQYALKAMGRPEPDTEKLVCFIGPPLTEQFMEYCHVGRKEAEYAVFKFRERFREKGVFENFPYEGVENMLKTLRERGKTLAVATSKPWVFAEQILTRFRLRSYFELVAGSELDGTGSKKAEVIQKALEGLGVTEAEKDRCLMIGDRLHDILGGKQIGLATMGVSFGYGGREELAGHGADYIVDSWEELLEIVG